MKPSPSSPQPERAVAAAAERMRALLELERRAEVEEARQLRARLSPAALAARGVALPRLVVRDEEWGAGGRLLLGLEPAKGGELPAHRLQPGDLVEVAPDRTAGAERGGRAGAHGAEPLTGVLYRVAARRVTIALDEEPEGDLDEPLRLLRVSSDVPYKRALAALERLTRDRALRSAKLRDVLLGLRDPRMEEVRAFAPLDEALDPTQRAAVQLALGARDVALIHGPPGTGKTTAAVEVIRQAARRGEKVLACAPSNIATDNLAERLIARGVGVVRLGHPARLLPAVAERSLDELVLRSEESRIARDVRREAAGALKRLHRAASREARAEARADLRRLRAELRELEGRAVRGVLAGAEVICATTTGAGDPVLAGLEFDLLLLDEAAQSLDPFSWIPLSLASRAVLVGDHLQLPPLVRSLEAEREGLSSTLFDRLAGRHGAALLRRLETQYRMHEAIQRYPSERLYDGALRPHASVAAHLLRDLPGVSASAETSTPLLCVDTAGCGLEEVAEEDGDSRSNPGEAAIVEAHVRALLGAGVGGGDVAVITPYNAQVDLLRAALRPLDERIEVGSVDGFQGREKEAVILSLVRSNERGDVGFLADHRRMNVAITRARRHLAVVGDSATAGRDPFLSGLFEHLAAHGEYRSAWEYR